VNDDIFFGNDRGLVLGPYTKGEIQPQLRAVEKLRGGEAACEVYAVPARSLAEAESKLQRELAREQREADREVEL
jgi:hypothetical protein